MARRPRGEGRSGLDGRGPSGRRRLPPGGTARRPAGLSADRPARAAGRGVDRLPLVARFEPIHCRHRRGSLRGARRCAPADCGDRCSSAGSIGPRGTRRWGRGHGWSPTRRSGLGAGAVRCRRVGQGRWFGRHAVRAGRGFTLRPFAPGTDDATPAVGGPVGAGGRPGRAPPADPADGAGCQPDPAGGHRARNGSLPAGEARVRRSDGRPEEAARRFSRGRPGGWSAPGPRPRGSGRSRARRARPRGGRRSVPSRRSPG